MTKQTASVKLAIHAVTHGGIAEYLSTQWAKTPLGPHCENTKSWPFCLSAAGLGLQLTDLTLGTGTHWVYDRWVEDAFKKNLPEGEKFHFLPKPFSLKQLAVAVKETLGR